MQASKFCDSLPTLCAIYLRIIMSWTNFPQLNHHPRIRQHHHVTTINYCVINYSHLVVRIKCAWEASCSEMYSRSKPGSPMSCCSIQRIFSINSSHQSDGNWTATLVFIASNFDHNSIKENLPNDFKLTAHNPKWLLLWFETIWSQHSSVLRHFQNSLSVPDIFLYNFNPRLREIDNMANWL